MSAPIINPPLGWEWQIRAKDEGKFCGDVWKRTEESSQVIPSYLSPGGRESESAARWKERGVEGRGGIFLQNHAGYVDLGAVFSLVTASGS